MVTRADIHAFASEIVHRFQPHRIILFGSHAYGLAGMDSDVDLLVVMPHDGNPIDKAIEIRSSLKHPDSLSIFWCATRRRCAGASIMRIGFCAKLSAMELCSMKPLTREWLDKAEMDVASYERLASGPNPPHDSVCFHAQQAAESS